MEELTTKINKAVEAAADLPEVPRNDDGTINLDLVALGKNEKENYIVPDEVMKAYYKELPNGTVNASGTYTAYNGGLLMSLNQEIRRKGGEALQAQIKQRRKLSETIDIFLRKKASNEEIEQLGLEAGASKQDALIAAMIARAIERGDVQAGIFLRDTAGEKPTDKVDASIMSITPADEELIKRVAARLPENGNS